MFVIVGVPVVRLYVDVVNALVVGTPVIGIPVVSIEVMTTGGSQYSKDTF
jgi:hypothetical protein